MTPAPDSRDPQPSGTERPASAQQRAAEPPDDWPRWAATEVLAALQDYVAAGGAPGAVVVLGDTTTGTGSDPEVGPVDGAGGHRVRTESVEVGLVAAECGPEPATADTLYDVASVTKMLAVWPLAGLAVREHGLDLDAPVERYLALPGSSERWPSAQVTTRQVLAHVSGLIRRTRLDLYREQARGLVEQICAEELEREVGAYRYLSRGYILLGLLFGRLFGRGLGGDLGRAAEELVWRPAGMGATGYGPVRRDSAVAPTERYFPDAPRIWGQAHDDAARLLGGVAGHAGVFATTADLAGYAGWLLNPHAPLADWLRESLRPVVSVPVAQPESEGAPVGSGLMRGLGWMLTDGGVAYHDGFTGPSLYLRPHPTGSGGRFLALGTNAVYAGRARPGLRKLRQLLLDTIEQSLPG